MDFLKALSPVCWLGGCSDDPPAETVIVEEVNSLQKYVRDYTVKNSTTISNHITIGQIRRGNVYKNITCNGCDTCIDASQTINATLAFDVNVSALTTTEFISEFKTKADQSIDAIIDTQREFLSPEDKRQLTLDLSVEMDQTIDDTFTVDNITAIETSLSIAQTTEDEDYDDLTFNCEPSKFRTVGLDVSQNIQADMVSNILVSNVFKALSNSTAGQEFIQRADLDYTYKATGPIGEYMRGIAGILSSLTTPLLLVGGIVLVIVVLMIIMGIGKKKPNPYMAYPRRW